MTPDFRIEADNQDITAIIRERFLELRLRDEAGLESDSCEIRLDDRAPHIALPRTGAVLEVALGYRETGLVAMGRWVVDEVSISGPPDTLIIRARAADLGQALRAPQERSWPLNTTIGDLVTTIAGEHGFIPSIADELAGITLPHIDQTESDLHLLTRLAREYDAVAKAAGGRLLFVPRAQARSAAGEPLAHITWTRESLTDYEVTMAERGKYAAVTTYWHDQGSAERTPVTVGEGEPVLTVRRAYPDAAAATAAAQSRLAATLRGAAVLRASGPGAANLLAEARLTITDGREGLAGEWSLISVDHTLNDGGYRCSIEAETPEAL
ncbi:contractile injection system protein, VgrG/Pvc8 family [Geoalkalibacter subterraneus]|uniref:Phage tail protein n=1 Tax=Geoalkalibacter subterraneus TaxID=483547 RepID=A0A0B5FSX6_9BACT|nr:contractile injection system protein, VgrG/Pvc8 family [Geoalkalibacter subterraneus]AJF07759.1 hypothetical protein GSUB_16015 [Geoalkalibacter subterraneus]